MSDFPATPAASPGPPSHGHDYVVVARRYRPQLFEELIGQGHVAKALAGAIESDRVGHAYLFTGARGVGKTSAARILAKALNCLEGTSPHPCGKCEICTSVASGDDVDVIEIDGASNRGIDEIRQLRQNVAVRPSRARFKIYIIDEVHMLTKEAFNALLKTLEEPPEHVKFIFATTEPNKIPITILSRCQRYDFAGIDAAAIQHRLGQIAAAEGAEVESDALALLAMRAAGSMRDSQSLLEQLLSTGSRSISAADVTGLLGLAPASRLSRLVDPLVNRDAAAALAEFDAALADGAEPGQLVDQLLGYFRDVMTQAVGCGPEQMLHALPGQRDEIRGVAQRLGVHTLLAISGILDHAASRLRVSTQVRTLVEMALVRICRLGDLDELAELIATLKTGATPAAAVGGASAVKKNGLTSVGIAPAPVAPRHEITLAPVAAESAPTTPPVASTAPVSTTAPAAMEPAPTVAADPGPSDPVVASLDAAAAQQAWSRLGSLLSGMLADHVAAAERIGVDPQGRLVASFPESKRFNRDFCAKPASATQIEGALAKLCGRRVVIAWETHPDPQGSAPPPRLSLRQRQAEIVSDPFVQKAMELFGGDPNRMKYVPPREE
ncbi:MAG: DNA polymerase III subunit gamma/tau [Pirellulales bacterium]|nr:DNA polymerase III subunit gamma/tau [Pirellulales bacterium]